MTEQKHLYIVFTSTNSGMGKLIRFFTRNKYNHASITLDDSLGGLNSFARHHKNVAFYGGYVNESCLRYEGALAKVAKIPLTDEQFDKAMAHFEGMAGDEGYIYNTLSAATNLLKKKVKVKKAYTCVEFVVETLDMLAVDERVCADKFYSVKDLEDIFGDKVIYEGEFPKWCENAVWGNDNYDTPLTFFKGSKSAIRAHLRLFKRLIFAS